MGCWWGMQNGVIDSPLTHAVSLSVWQDVDKWSFDVFSLNEASGDHALKFIFYELLTRYDLISRFKVSSSFKKVCKCTVSL